MKANIEWLKDWVDFSYDSKSLADSLTILGLEVDSVSNASPFFDKVVVANVDQVKAHPNADQLSLCIINDGKKCYEVVCGARNIRPNIKVAFAPINTNLPNGLKIKKAKIRDLNSSGMVCSAEELCIEDKSSGILELPEDAPIGELLSSYLKSDDYIIDIDLTPNRGDCFSIYGIAREIAANLGKKIIKPKLVKSKLGNDEILPIEIHDQSSCPKYIGRIIKNINNNLDSPIWLKERLRRNGLRSINPIVDVTNYVMLEIGQPLHSFDLKNIDSRIIVRNADAKERIELLDGAEVNLDSRTLIIADKAGPIAIAGVMGGANSAVSSTTDSIFLESAFFSPNSIIGRARSYNLQTDASIRFERGVDFELQEIAIEMASKLLIEISGASCGPIIKKSENKNYPIRKDILLRPKRVELLLGIKIDKAKICKYLNLLCIATKLTSKGIIATPPSYRFDLSIEEDLIEEVARLFGYGNIPVVTNNTPEKLGTSEESLLTKDYISDVLVSKGYNELITYSFIDKDIDSLISDGEEQIFIINPISSDCAVLRRSLWPGLINAAKQNLSRQHERIKFFEIGTEFIKKGSNIQEKQSLAGIMTGLRIPEQWSSEDVFFDFFDAKGDIELLFDINKKSNTLRFEKEDYLSLWPGQSSKVYLDDKSIGRLGLLHPFIQDKLSFRSPVVLFSLDLDSILRAKIPQYENFSKFPSVRRDISIIVNNDISAKEVIDIVRENSANFIEKIFIFDIYRDKNIGFGEKSMSLGLILRDSSRTLRDSEADVFIQSILDSLIDKLDVRIR